MINTKEAYLAAMKQQTIGVEIEMNRITRPKAAELIAGYFGTNVFKDTHLDNGYCCWSAWDTQGREWKCQRDTSIHGDDDHKCELVTPILTYDDIPALQDIVRLLRKNRATSNPHEGCGVHIHIGAKGHTPETLRNLVNIMAAHEGLLISAINIDPGRVTEYCRTVHPDFLKAVNEKKPSTMADLADCWYVYNHATYGRTHHYNESRYHMLNLHATFTKGTVEFRLFQFDNPTRNEDGTWNNPRGLHAGQLKSYIQLCLAMSHMAKATKKANPKPLETDNPKYAMRTWLLRLGFIGEEFATARDVLTRRLEGDAAFRHGRAAS